jgi:hypothetical protein
MSNFFDDFLAELKTTFTTAVSLPNPATGFINWLTTVQGTKHSFVEMLRSNADVKFSLPGMIIDIGDFELKDADPIMNSVGLIRAPITIIYVTNWGGSTGTQNSCFGEALLLKNSIDKASTPFNNFFLAGEEGKILTNVDCPVNSALMANAQVDIIASAVQWLPGLVVQV